MSDRSVRTGSKPRVVVTGMGAITPLGHNVQEIWEALIAGKSGIVRLTVMDTSPWHCQIGGEIRGWEAERYLSQKQVRNMTFTSQLAVVASQQAIEDSGITLAEEDPTRIGVVVGTSGGSIIEETERAALQMDPDGVPRMTPVQTIRLWPNMPAYHIAEEFQVQGYSSTICTACASGTQAIGEGAEVIRRGAADVVICGGSDSVISRIGFAGFDNIRALARSFNDRPEQASRPFDAKREGFVAAQGCGMVVLESLDHAEARGARILAEVLGLGVTNQGHHMIAPQPEGQDAAEAMKQAFRTSGVSIEEVDYINAHGTGTPLGDSAETRAIKSVFGERAYDVPVSSTKSMTGHMKGAAGAVEAIVTVMTIQSGIIHPTINYQYPDPECDLDYVPNEAREAEVRVGLTNSFGLGGQNASLILGAL